MGKACEVCGKSPQMGNSITTRGKAKYLGGVGTKVTGITRRQFKPNLQRLRVTVQGSNRTMRVCTQCMRSGAITKLVRAAPFKLPTDGKAAGKAAEKKTAGKPPAKGKKSVKEKTVADKATTAKATEKAPAEKTTAKKPPKS
ncbi:MAG TPA: 50S ribosomal protein L28 [Pirellulales bacterium]|nr:50S ribosomal protein L28 [Pirellulales bacterium]